MGRKRATTSDGSGLSITTALFLLRWHPSELCRQWNICRTSAINTESSSINRFQLSSIKLHLQTEEREREVNLPTNISESLITVSAKRVVKSKCLCVIKINVASLLHSNEMRFTWLGSTTKFDYTDILKGRRRSSENQSRLNNRANCVARLPRSSIIIILKNIFLIRGI